MSVLLSLLLLVWFIKIYLFIDPWSGIIVYSQDEEGVRGKRSSSKCVDQGCDPHTNSLEASQCMRTYGTSVWGLKLLVYVGEGCAPHSNSREEDEHGG